MARSKKSYENWGRKCRICGWSKTGLSKKNEDGHQYRWCPYVNGLINLKVYKGNKGWNKYDNTSRDVRKTL